ncbi:hypothetical protein [Streptomyces natalensis]|uniref:Uncharacterized protein n=1 Tax=Streptomyces natalensis ATCC 27448 TaxID=1240678 RepID=A0A0D7CQS7_9ACTN|nr:hypothetical protein [Streptomyces natalensis]KIZ18406.1 hypothetical protein SNA_07205 [Streptomyces natalensis ATCC 27448]
MSASKTAGAALTRDDFRVKIAVQRVRQDGADHRVIRPAGPLKNGALYRARQGYDLLVDRPDGRRIGTLLLLAARSPRSVVYLPLRATAPEPWFGRGGDEEPLDLVLAHRAVQLRPSFWKQLRTRVNAANAPRELRTARVPASDLPEAEHDGGVHDAAARPAPYAPGSEDRLGQHVHARTLVLTGGPTAFREAAREVFAVTKDGPPAAASGLYLNGGCNYHVCRALYSWPDLSDRREQIHVEFAPSWAR